MRVGPEPDDWCAQEKGEGGLRHRHSGEGPGEDGGRDWREAATSQGTLGAPRSWKKTGRTFFGASEGRAALPEP